MVSTQPVTSPGTPQHQITVLTERINDLTGHLKTHKKDQSSKRGLMNMVSRRSRVMKYLKNSDPAAYRTLCDTLSLRG